MPYKGGGAQATTKINLKASFSIADYGYQTNICNPHQSVYCTACKVYLEFAWKILAHRISYKEPCNCFCIRGSIEFFFRTNTCKVTAHYVSHGVTTGLSCSKAYFNKAPHYLTYILKLHPMKLNVLTSRYVS